MSSILVINAAGRETRVALVENGHISEFYLERKKDRGIVGNIYKGRVARVLPGMQAAFVDVGLDKAAFLYVTDVLYDPLQSHAQFELTEGESEDAPDVPDLTEDSEDAVDGAPVCEIPVAATHEAFTPQPPGPVATSLNLTESSPQGTSALPPPGPGDIAAPPSGPPDTAEAPAAVAAGELRVASESGRDQRSPNRPRRQRDDRDSHGDEEKPKQRKASRIEDLLKPGQEVLVQISKDPISTKGARLTSHISIPGRHLVFMPTVDHVGISRRIANEKERRRLREMVDRLRPPGTGFIVRTVAENVPSEKLESDIRFLIQVWNDTVRGSEARGGPGLVHPDLDLILRATRDLFAQDVEQLVIDDREEYDRVINFVTAQDPTLKERVILHDSEEPVFDAYGIEQEIHRAVQRKVWLKSGGYLIIDQTEALTAIDVNSGRYVGKKSLEETITRINVEAAKEIVYQLRLRNIGGIIICDFIDMEKQQNREKVFKTLQEALGRDKAKTNVLRISELGLVEMTRKRVRESIGRMLHEDCQYCGGQGYVKTATTVCYEIFRDLRREGSAHKEPTLVINCSDDVAALLQGEERQELRHLMDRFNKSIQVKEQPAYHREHYDIYGRSAEGAEHKVSSAGDGRESQSYGGPKRQQAPAERIEREGQGRGRNRNEHGRSATGRDRNRPRDRGQGATRAAETPKPPSAPSPVAESTEADAPPNEPPASSA